MVNWWNMKNSLFYFVLFRTWKIITQNFELLFWLTSLILLAGMNPENNLHYSLCIFKFLGFTFCPGCGLGHSISFLFRGDITSSIHAHPLGIFALLIITLRIYKLSFLSFQNIKANYHAARI